MMRTDRTLRLLLSLTSAALLLAAAACGGGDRRDDERIKQIGGVAELATYAYAGAGADGLYDYLAPEVTQRCSKEQLRQALSAQPQPTGFRGLSGVDFEDGRAQATLTLIFRNRDQNVEWTFVQTTEGSWRIADLPGLQECAG